MLAVGSELDSRDEPGIGPGRGRLIVRAVDGWDREVLIVGPDDGQNRAVLTSRVYCWIKVVEEGVQSAVCAYVRDSVTGVRPATQAVSRLVVEAVVQPRARIEQQRMPVSGSGNRDRAFDSIVHPIDVVGKLAAHRSPDYPQIVWINSKWIQE